MRRVPLKAAAAKFLDRYDRLGVRAPRQISTEPLGYIANFITQYADVMATAVIGGKKVEGLQLQAPCRLSYDANRDALVGTDGAPYADAVHYSAPTISRFWMWWAQISIDDVFFRSGHWPREVKMPPLTRAAAITLVPIMIQIWQKHRQLRVSPRPDFRGHLDRDVAGEWPDDFEASFVAAHGSVAISGPCGAPADAHQDLNDAWTTGIKPPKDRVYEWKRFKVMGEDDALYIRQLERAGWRKVPRRRHPKAASESRRHLVIGGAVLMEIGKKRWFDLKANAIRQAQNQVAGALGFRRPGEPTQIMREDG